MENILEKIIFNSRWLQVPVYFGLIIGTVFYSVKFLIELFHIVSHFSDLTEAAFMLGMLSLIDITMVINLLVIVTIGGYATFVSKLNLSDSDDKPYWLDKIDAGTMKTKLAVSLVGVSGIHLLKVFINIESYQMNTVVLQIIIHFVFLLSSIMLAYSDKLTHSKHQQKS